MTAVAGPRVEVPAESRVDEALPWRLAGLEAGEQVEVGLQAEDGDLVTWCSRAWFTVAEDGTVDAARQGPDRGSYDGIDTTGLLWALTTGERSLPPAFFRKGRPTPISYRLEVRRDGDVVATAGFLRHFGSDTVVGEPLSLPDPVGTLMRARTGAPAPGVLLWSGSDGGQLDHAAMLLAAQGYTVLSLALFGVEDRPKGLERIDLGYVDAAITWLLDHESTVGDEVALVSLSRGAELALQVAADDPRVGAVVAGAPSSVRQPGIKPNSMDFSLPAWERDGEPLPFLASSVKPRDWLGVMGAFVRRRPMRQVEGFRRRMRDAALVQQASIEVERCRGPLMLLAGEEDQLWPSGEYVDRIEQRLADHGWAGRLEVVRSPGVGHFVCFPYALPSLPPMTAIAPSASFSIDFGGSPAAHAAAAGANWHRQLDFLGSWAHQVSPTPVTSREGRPR
ncbi:acyl-CoA thioesterase/bile acid-CoA:amino acid N-acyltransferase family protein [Modestobacter sp. VKM Ac-2977]|uniref:acyl-CoA thioesterase/bile acid-CoA:amino acid N-acyltransferase family protein n=1 Tax=Modestobacter sp. VKM Ac-2977 TaxID=3004131 RepID=UPI0022AA38E9|nr:acyl-CoA thioesterase/bile acid-CoA:amino acid N-acyltransferase family protein [Modestobacter sp. VKM Ac-2977]MCZ2819836.1 acyl-CoA thioesterase/bile acid-CoA:amino acid N-acyltransferase family protein [Modestobacter sp. VKM Ac-2977]